MKAYSADIIGSDENKASGLPLKWIHLTLIASIVLRVILTDEWGYSSGVFSGLPVIFGNHLYVYISRILWAAPFMVLIIKYSNRIWVGSRDLFLNKIHTGSTLAAITILATCLIWGMIFINNGFLAGWAVWMKFLSRYLVVGFVEEIVYRGWGLNALAVHMSAKKANLISAVYFGSMYIPSFLVLWYLGDNVSAGEVIYFVFVNSLFGNAFGYLFRKSKSIIPSVCVNVIFKTVTALFLSGG